VNGGSYRIIVTSLRLATKAGFGAEMGYAGMRLIKLSFTGR
jgi:hypothetical protein